LKHIYAVFFPHSFIPESYTSHSTYSVATKTVEQKQRPAFKQ